MSEDEEFYIMEQRAREKDYIDKAKREGEKFIASYGSSLGSMTLRQVFELGYRFGLSDREK